MERDRDGSAGWIALPVVACLLFLILAGDAARRETPTVDEFAHLPAGHAYLEHGWTALYAKNPPLGKMLMALPGRLVLPVAVPEPVGPPLGWGPWRYGTRFLEANAEHYLDHFRLARWVVVLLTALTGVLVFRWARDLFGVRPAAVATGLFYLAPTVLAHGHLATLDGLCTLTLFGTAFALRWAGARPSFLRFAAVGVAWGVALLVKFTAVLLLPALGLLVPVLRWPRWRRALGDLAVLAVAALLVVNLGLGFRGSLAPLSGHAPASAFARGVHAVLPGWLPVPLPRDWVRGFDAQKRDVEQGEFPSYLMGVWSKDGFASYDVVAFLVKTPLPFVPLLLAAGLCLWRRPPPGRELALLLAPLAVILFFQTAFNHLDIGIRYLLPLFPFLFVVLAALWRSLPARLGNALAAVVVAWYGATALAVHPGHLAYFNLAAGGPEAGHRWLLDSNLDWGQDLYRLPAALAELGVEGPLHLLYFGHVDPGLYGLDYRLLPRRPVQGVVAVSVSYLQGFAYPVTAPDGALVPVRRDHASWLRGLVPVRRLGSIWLFDTRRRPDAP